MLDPLPTPFSVIPPEISTHILSYLSFQQLQPVSAVCQLFSEISNFIKINAINLQHLPLCSLRLNADNTKLFFEKNIKSIRCLKFNQKTFNKNLSLKNVNKIERLSISHLTNKGHEIFSDLTSLPNFNSIISLKLSNCMIDSQIVEKLFAQQHFCNLKKLNLNFNEIGIQGAFHLSQANLSSLKRLDLKENGICDEGLKHLTNGLFQNIELLDLENNQIRKIENIDLGSKFTCLSALNLNFNMIKLNDEVLAQLKWPSLAYLGLAGNKIKYKNIILFKNNSFLQNIELIDLGFNLLGDLSIRELSINPDCTSLINLNIDLSGITTEGIYDLAYSQFFENLTFLNISGNNVGYQGMKFISKSSFARKLTYLFLSNCKINHTSAGILRKKIFSNLHMLDISQNKILNKGIIRLSKGLENLTFLNLNDCNISSEAVNYLTRSKFFSNLSVINLSQNRIGDKGLLYLTSCQHCSLQTLNLSNNQITFLGANYLANASQLTTLAKLNLRNNDLDAGKSELNTSHFLKGCYIKMD